MTAPVIGFTAEVERGLFGESYIQIEPTEDGAAIEVSLFDQAEDEARCVVVTHDEARQIIAGLASVIT